MTSPAVTTLTGSIDLVLPPDLFDLMSPVDPDEARVEFLAVFGQMFPRMTLQDLGVMADGLLLWRDRLMTDGVILHGLVAVPAGDGVETPAHWHILAGVVDVPAAAELDTGAVAAAYFGQELSDDRSYVESFDTEMGWGVGIITEVPFNRPLGAPDLPPPATGAAMPSVLGMAAGLSAERGGHRGLLVVGMCFDLERTLDMAAVVAAIAGNSTFHRDEHEGAHEAVAS